MAEALKPLSGPTPEQLGISALGVPREPVIGQTALILGTSGKRAVHAGKQMLESGGTAVDAALTTALAQVALASGAWVSYAGLLNLLYYEKATGKVHSLNAALQSPKDESDPLTIPKRGGRTVLVPGFLAGVEAAHRRFGSVPFSAIFEPAIDIAENGFEIDSMLGAYLKARRKVLTRLPQTEAIFKTESGAYPTTGDHFHQLALAETLQRVKRHGARETIYEGEWGARFVEEVRRMGGRLSQADLSSYRPLWTEPVEGEFANTRVYSHGLPGFGGVGLVEGLHLLEESGIAEIGRYFESADALFWLMQISAAVTSTWAGPDVLAKLYEDLDMSLEGRTKRETAKKLWQLLEKGDAHFGILPQSVGGGHSDAVVAVDAAGNVAVLVHSINTLAWGNTGLFVDGISISDGAAAQKTLIHRVGPGARIPDSTNPVIALRAGVPVLAMGTIGSGLHTKTLVALHNVLNFDMRAKDALDAPTLAQLVWSPFRQRYIHRVGKEDFDAELIAALRQRGQRVKQLSGFPLMLASGYGALATMDPASGRLEGAVSREIPGWGEAL